MNEFHEQVKYYKGNKRKIGRIDREEGIEKNLLLEAVQIWIINPDNNQVLMQRRSYEKQNDPGMIDVSASGIVKYDEVPMQAIIREGKEELGEEAFKKLIDQIKKMHEFEVDFTKEGRKGKYLTHEYLTYSRLSLEEYIKQDEEVDELFFMDYEEVKKLIRNKDKEMRIPYNDDIEELLQKIDIELELYNKRTVEEDGR